VKVEEAVEKTVERIDHFISGGKISLPSPAHRRACEEHFDKRSASVKTATLFLMYHWSVEPGWDMDSVPVGARGPYGDKRLCEQLTGRSITLHNAITAYGENLGWKGNVRAIRLSNDHKFGAFLRAVAGARGDTREINRIADFLAQRFAESKRETPPLPPLGSDVLTFVRAKRLFHALLATRSEGHIQQFLIAALLSEFRRRHGIEVSTHHPHAADKFDNTAGDIEEHRDGQLIRAYEVTVRDDWENRLSNFRDKMDRSGLTKYVILAAGINTDTQWSVPATMALRLEEYGRDIAVVDINDVVNFFAAELMPAELRAAVNLTYTMLSDRRLSGRIELMDMYKSIVRDWLDEVS
jgi:hypothetical protein